MKSKWKEQNVVKVYELAKSGLRESQIARVLGISKPTFLQWEKSQKTEKRLFKQALILGRKAYRGRGKKVKNFRDYVFQRLSTELKIIWNEINRLDEAETGVEKIEAILMNQGKRVRQHLFIYAWTASNFSISQALRKVNISRGTFESWKNHDPDFLKLIDEINWHKKNFFEDSLTQLVAGGDTSATIFANETLNKDRGYSKKMDIDINQTITQSTVNIDELELPLETRKQLLQAIRAGKEKNIAAATN